MDNLETHDNIWAQDTERRQKAKNTTQKTKKMSNTHPTKNPGKQFLFLIYSSVMDTVNSSERGVLWL